MNDDMFYDPNKDTEANVAVEQTFIYDIMKNIMPKYKCSKHGVHDDYFGNDDIGMYCFHCITEHFNSVGIERMTQVDDGIERK